MLNMQVHVSLHHGVDTLFIQPHPACQSAPRCVNTLYLKWKKKLHQLKKALHPTMLMQPLAPSPYLAMCKQARA